LDNLEKWDNYGHLGDTEDLTRLRRCELDTTTARYSGAGDELPALKCKECLGRLRDYRQHTVPLQLLVIFQYNGTLYKYFTVMNKNRVMT
jgi:hypothetical protein